MSKNVLKKTKWSILICVILLIGIGLTALYSASIASNFAELKKQIIWIAISIPIFLIAYMIDYRIIARFAVPLYIISILLLIFVLLTKAINGATSWFNLGSFSLQPGEFAKIAVIMFGAVILEKNTYTYRGRNIVNKPLKLLMVSGIVLLPVLLIVLQPDYGTAVSYLLALVLMLFVAGIDKKYIIISILIMAVLLPLLYFYVLPQHAKDRINVYLNPNIDPRGAGYNIIQSKLAIGGGRLLGQGYLKGTQTHLGFLYPKTTDFIFAVIGEEIGFIMCTAIVIIYVVMITKCITVAKTAADDLGSYMAMGFSRNTIIPRSRKYRYDNRSTSNNRSTTSIYKLWRKLTYYKYDNDCIDIKYKHQKSKAYIFILICLIFVMRFH